MNKEAALIQTSKFHIPHSLVVLTTGECLYEYVASTIVFCIYAQVIEKQQNRFSTFLRAKEKSERTINR